MKNFDIDLIYLWVDGSDEQWLKRKQSFLGETFNQHTEALSKARNANNNELKYSLRSVAKHAPWIRKIFILTDGQCPSWLNLDHPQIEIIDIAEILPKESLPCYNSVVIEYFLYKIPDLAEHFLYANDDMFINENVDQSFFFTKDGYPIVKLQRAFCGKLIFKLRNSVNLKSNIYRKTIAYAAELVEKRYGKYYSGIPHHNIDAYLKSDYKEAVENAFRDEIAKTIKHHTRQDDDIQRAIFSYYSLAKKHAKIQYVGRKDSARIRVQKGNFMQFLETYNPKLFCVNDTHKSTDDNRQEIEPFLTKIFPEPCSFERQL